MKKRLNHFLCGIEEWATLALSHSCGEGCLHPVSLPIAYTADYVKAACSEASADALTWADVYATHPTEIVIDPKLVELSVDLFHCIDRISREGVQLPFRGVHLQKGVQSERLGRPDKLEFTQQQEQ